MKITISILLVLLGIYAPGKTQTPLYTDDFSTGVSNWVSETESDSVVIKNDNHVLEIISPKGLTLWLKKPLEGNIKISYEAMVVNEKGKYDRVSDLNSFWMATDPENPDNLFARATWRKGVFGKYYSLAMYYVGYGGNSNTTTRFRKYNGDYQSFVNKTMRPDILKEYTDTAHLIKPNRWSKIEIIVNNGNNKYIFNNELLFDYDDPNPYKKGYFGIRTVTNHLKVRNFQITKL